MGADPEDERFLLDTNIFRLLACGDLPDEERRIRAVFAQDRTPPFFTSDLGIQELASHMIAGEAGSFEMIRRAFEWMDRLCGNSKLAPNSGDNLKTVLFEKPVLTPEDRYRPLNAFRRRLIKLSSFDAMLAPDKELCAEGKLATETEREEWVVEQEKFREKLRAASEGNLAGSQIREAVAIVQDAFFGAFRAMGETFEGAFGRVRDRTEVEERLREYIHFDAAIVVMTLQKNGYNFRKHRTDYHDRMLCAYAGIGFTIVTADQRLARTLAIVECPSPRLITLGQALTTIEAGLGG